jgi:hypothetical protein
MSEFRKRRGRSIAIVAITVLVVLGVITLMISHAPTHNGFANSEAGQDSTSLLSGDYAVINAPHSIGCWTTKPFETFTELARDHDTVAQLKAITLALETGDCVAPREGTRVTVEETSILRGLTKVRENGELTTYWITTSDLRQP